MSVTKLLSLDGLDAFLTKIKAFVSDKLSALSVSQVGGNGKVITSISQNNGKISATDALLSYNDLHPIMSKTYKDLIASSNTYSGSGCDFLPIEVTPTDALKPWSVTFRVKSSYTNNDTVYWQSSTVDVWNNSTRTCVYKSQNVIDSTSYRAFYYTIAYRSSNSKNYLGFSLYGAKNPTSTSHKRDVDVEILAYDGCSVVFRNSISNTDYTTYITGRTKNYFDAANNGLQETGDANDPNYRSREYRFRPYAGSTIYARKICALDKNNHMQPLSLTEQPSSGDVVAKTPNSTPFWADCLYYYDSSSTYTAGNNTYSSWYSRHDVPDSSHYTFSEKIATYQAVYLKGTLDFTSGLFTLDTTSTTSWYVCVPINNSGDIVLSNYFASGSFYVFIGGNAGDANCLQMRRPTIMYYYDGTKLIEVNAVAGRLLDSAGSANHPVYFNNGVPTATTYELNKSVPSNAVFTDTTYSDATTSTHGLMSSADKIKLNGIATGATANVGTITGISMNGLSKGTSGSVNLGNILAADANQVTTTELYLNTHPENRPIVLPFINNDIAFLLSRGGGAVLKYDDVSQTIPTDFKNMFDGSPSYFSKSDMTGITELSIELTLHKAFTWSTVVYIDNGADNWRAKNVSVEVMNSNYEEDVWTSKKTWTNYDRGQFKVTINHTPVGASSVGGGFNKLRIKFSNFYHPTGIFRIACIGLISYHSYGIREICLTKDGGEMYGDITPFANNGINIGSSSKKINNVYASYFRGNGANLTNVNASTVGGHTVAKDVPSNAVFTDTTYNDATTSSHGLMSASDKIKLNNTTNIYNASLL